MSKHRFNASLRPLLLFMALFANLGSVAVAEPKPGDVFREYTYTNTYGDAGGAIRVGGKQGVSYPDRGSDFGYVNAWKQFPHQLDLNDAIRAEVVVEKILSHNGTRGLAIQWNQGDWLDVPAPEAIPKPRSDYYHHACISVPIRIADLKPDATNQFRLRVDPDQDWGWPQNLVYGVHLRIYYDSSKKVHVAGRVSRPRRGEQIGRKVPLAIEVSDRSRRINRVDFLAHYEGVNWEGDGQYRRWHYFYYHGNLIHHLASSVTPPFAGLWDTSWVPDQDEPIQIAARIIDDTQLIHMTPVVSDLRLKRPGFSVELCRPENVPDNWVTRSGAHNQTVNVTRDPRGATAARLVWSSWSPGYMNGVYVNERKILQTEGPRYRYYDHRVDIKDISVIKLGHNTISTGKTPLHDGKMVHGMEVNWPGIQLLIQHDSNP